jgi:hypothetical protein
MMLRRNLRWALAATLGVTALALWGPEETGLSRSAAADPSTEDLIQSTAAPVAALKTLARDMEPLAFSQPQRDLFSPVMPAPAPPPMAKPALPAAAAPPAPAPPSPPPPPSARYMAHLLTPSGERVVYLIEGDAVIAAKPGVVLSGGYVVEALLTADTVEPAAAPGAPNASAAGGAPTGIAVVHQPSMHRVVIPVPSLDRPPDAQR